MAALVRAGPDPAEHGVVRWRRVDLAAVIERRFGVRLAEWPQNPQRKTKLPGWALRGADHARRDRSQWGDTSWPVSRNGSSFC